MSSNTSTRALTGDVTYLNGEVTELGHELDTGQPLAKVRVVMTNQDGAEMASGDAEVRLPNP